MNTFFIHRPIFAWVIAILVMVGGALSIKGLPVNQYPDIAPPSVSISTMYQGADAETIENNLVQVIEQSLTGIDGLLYFSSSSESNGRISINLTFTQDTDPDTAQVQVQNKVQLVMNKLPEAVQRQGVSVNKSQSDFLMIAALYDTTNTRSNVDLSNYLTTNIQDPISRLEGVGSVRVFGASYAMRLWLDPIKLKEFELMPSDIESAVRTQNVEFSAGKIGASPSLPEQMFTATVKGDSKLKTVDDFESIILAQDSNGAAIRIRDVARVELGQDVYGVEARLNNLPAAGIAVMLSPGANALDTSDRVRTFFEHAYTSFPEGVELAFPKDNTEFIKLSIAEVLKTLAEAILLVIAVMFLFLQNWRATLIPTMTIPVVLLGTLAVIYGLGYSINTLTLFAMVLAIGLLVDDSIVVVENVERIMHEKKVSAKEATIETMQTITSALIGIALVLSAVFLPMAFFDGASGVIYRQFSITIVTAMTLSVLVSIILTPAICASFLKKPTPHNKGFFGLFNRLYDGFQNRYQNRVVSFLRAPIRMLTLYGLLLAGGVYLFNQVPTGFIPNEDQGDVMVMYTLPKGATLPRTNEVGEEVLAHFKTAEKDNVKYVFTLSGFNFSGMAENAGMAFVGLNHWSERQGEANSAAAIALRANMAFSQIEDATAFALVPPAIRGMGQSSGFTFYIQGIGTRDQLARDQVDVMQRLQANEKLTNVRINALPDNTQLNVSLNRESTLATSANIADAQATLSAAWGGRYINDFVYEGRIKKVYMQGEVQYRTDPESLADWHVRTQGGEMAPLDTLFEVKWHSGPEKLVRYKGLPAIEIQGEPAAGISIGEAMAEIEAIMNDAPGALTYEWSGVSYQQKASENSTTLLYALSILVIFLCLAALYESWTIPMAVMLMIPLGILGAVAATFARDLMNDVYFQVALLTTIGLSSKNAILIVEFAASYMKSGYTLIESAQKAARDRLRPILMTSLAFIAGVMPLTMASGAGANSRISIGTAVAGGTFAGTVFAIIFVPVFFVIVNAVTARFSKGEKNHA